MMLAKEVMTPTAIVAPLEMLVTELAALLREKRIGGVPVKDERGKFCGIVTVTDLFKVMGVARNVGGGKSWFSPFVSAKNTMTVRDIFTRKLVSVLPNTPLEYVVNLMLDENIHTIPVMSVDQTEIYGVIGRHDIISAAFESIKQHSSI